LGRTKMRATTPIRQPLQATSHNEGLSLWLAPRCWLDHNASSRWPRRGLNPYLMVAALLNPSGGEIPLIVRVRVAGHCLRRRPSTPTPAIARLPRSLHSTFVPSL
jgi:hypothetical protein